MAKGKKVVLEFRISASSLKDVASFLDGVSRLVQEVSRITVQITTIRSGRKIYRALQLHEQIQAGTKMAGDIAEVLRVAGTLFGITIEKTNKRA